MSIIHNWADDKFFHVIPKEENPFIIKYELSDKFVLLYSGNLALYNSFDTILESAKKTTDPETQFLIIGNGGRRKEIENYVLNNSLSNVKIMDYLPLSELPYSISSCDATFITVRDGINGINMPSKLYTIMACGKPMIALGEKGGDVHQMIKDAECGIFVEQGDINGLLNAIDFYRKNPEISKEHGLNGRKYFEKHYTLEIISKQYFELLSGVE
jgi:glycosyltransferase involved in cell wall biosynthesis